jgi:hypothetical protein
VRENLCDVQARWQDVGEAAEAQKIVEVAVDAARHTGVLHLHCNHPAVQHARRVHLPYAGRRNGLHLEMAELRTPPWTQLRVQSVEQLLLRHGVGALSHTVQDGGPLRRHHALVLHAQHLPQLQRRAPHLAQACSQPLPVFLREKQGGV